MTNTGYSNGSSIWGIFVGTTATVSGATAEGIARTGRGPVALLHDHTGIPPTTGSCS